MTDEMPPFRDMFHIAQKDGLYTMHKEVDRFVKNYPETPTITEGVYQHPSFGSWNGDTTGNWRPSEIHVTSRTPDDDLRAAEYKRQQMRDENPPNKDMPLTDEEKQQRVDNINQNNRELGLKS